MNEMSDFEFSNLIKEAFEGKYFNGDDGFVFTKQALLDGLMALQVDSMEAEEALHQGNGNLKKIERIDCYMVIHLLRRMQAVASILSTGLEDVTLQRYQPNIR